MRWTKSTRSCGDDTWGGGAKGAEVIDGTGVVQEMGLKGVSAGV